MKRILIVGMHPDIGGVETFIMNYFRHIDRTKIMFDFINWYDHICFEEEIIQLGGKIFNIVDVKKNPLKNYIQLKNIMKNYEIIHIQMLSAANIIPLLAAKKAKVKHRLVHSHNGNTPKSIIKSILHLINRSFIIKNSTELLACSNLAGRWMFKGNKFRVINNAIEINKYAYNKDKRTRVRKELNIQNELVIGHIGRFAEQKNHVFLIEVFEKIVKLNSNTLLLLVGTGSELEKIKNKVEKLNLTNKVKFLGLRNDIADILQAIDIFLLPSLFEGLPVTGIEAETSGVQCFFSKNISQEINITNSYFIDLNEKPEKWAEKILLLNEKYERKPTGLLIEKAGYSIENEAQKLKKYYLSL